MPSRLARSLHLSIRGNDLKIESPVLVPSFSSKAFVDVKSIFSVLQPFITESFLVSAYDIVHHGIRLPEGAPAEVLFLDSGGYEVYSDHDPMKPLYETLSTAPWLLEDYQSILNDTETIMPTFATSFDHPDLRQAIAVQIEDAVKLFQEFPVFGREFLVKPESHHQKFVDMTSIASHVDAFREFDIIGLTEAELGDSVLMRMSNIAILRQLMDIRKIQKPLHIYGSLDPVCTPLYFLAGADIFDGLSWLRFAYRDELAVYHRNRVPLDFDPSASEDVGRMRSYTANLHYLVSVLTPRLKRYLIDRDECRLGTHSGFFAETLDNLRVRTPGVV